MDADADLHLVVGDVESRLAGRRHRTARQRDPDRTRGRIDAIAEGLQSGKAASFFGSSAHDFFHDQRAGDAAPAGRKGRFLHRNVVIGNHGRNRVSRHLACHVEVHDVALVVLDDEQHAATGVRRLGGRENEIGRRRSEDLAGTCRIQHSLPDESGVKRLVSGAPTRHQRHFARLEMLAQHERRLCTDPHNVGMCSAESGETFLHLVLDRIDQFLHPGLPPVGVSYPRSALRLSPRTRSRASPTCGSSARFQDPAASA